MQIALGIGSASAQTQPQLRAQQHFLHDFSLGAIGIVLLVVLAILGVRRLTRRS